MSSIAKPKPFHDRIPATLFLATLVLATIAAVPTGLLGGSASVGMMALGAGVGLAAVLAGSSLARLALRGPDRFGVKLVVGGFVFRLVLLALLLTALVRVAGLPLERFILWLVFFYFALVVAEAWILARRSTESPSPSVVQEPAPR